MKPIDYILKFNKEFYSPIFRGAKKSTIRKDSKPIHVGDFVVAYFPEVKKGVLLKITDHCAKRLSELNNEDAKDEGYFHQDILKHTLHLIYPDLKDDDYVYIYKFERMNRGGYDAIVNSVLLEHGVDLE